MNRSNTGGIIAVVIAIIIAGGMIALAVSGRSSATGGSTSSDNMAGHHGDTPRGQAADLTKLVGKPAPDFQLIDHNGQSYALDNLKGKNVILFFNEGMMCYPACWNQIAALGSDQRFKTGETVALSVVTDSTKEWQKAMAEMPELNAATVVHDIGGIVSSRYGMLTTASSMHYGQLPGHSYVVIDKDGIVRHVYDDPNMAIHNNQLDDELKKLSA